MINVVNLINVVNVWNVVNVGGHIPHINHIDHIPHIDHINHIPHIQQNTIKIMSKLFTVAFFGILFSACQTDPISTLQQKLVALDKAMGGANVTDKSKAAEFIKTSEELAGLVEKSNPDQYVDVLLKAAGLAKTIENPQKAIELYSKVVDGLPQHKKAPTALFMIGFVQENDMADLTQAKATYELFLQKYPNDTDFADDAQNALKLLGKSPDDIIKEFEKQGQGQQ